MKKLEHRRSTAAGILAAMGDANAFDASSNTPAPEYGSPPDFGPEDNELGNVYGPPGGNMTRRAFTAAGILAAMGAAAAFVSRCNSPVGLYGPPPDYEPDENELETVYGPPEDYEPDDNESPETNHQTTDFDAQNNEVAGVYGPPDDYDPSANELVEVYGPPEDFDVTINEPECLYGPPTDD